MLGGGAMAIVRRVAAGAKVLLGDVSEKNLERAAVAMRFNGYDVETMVVNALDKDEVYAFAAKAAGLGDVMWFVDMAGASPSQDTPQFIIDLDLIGTSYALDVFGPVVARGGAGHADSQPAGITKCVLNAESGRTRAAQDVQSCVQSGEVYAGAGALRLAGRSQTSKAAYSLAKCTQGRTLCGANRGEGVQSRVQFGKVYAGTDIYGRRPLAALPARTTPALAS